MWLLAVSAVFWIDGSLGIYTQLSEARENLGEGNIAANRVFSINNLGRSNLDDGRAPNSGIGRDRQITIKLDGSRNDHSSYGLFERSSDLERTSLGHNPGRSDLDDGRARGSGFDSGRQITINLDGSRGDQSFSRRSNLDRGRLTDRIDRGRLITDNMDRTGQLFSRHSNLDGGRLPNGPFERSSVFERTAIGQNPDRSMLGGGRAPYIGNSRDRQISFNLDGSRANSRRTNLDGGRFADRLGRNNNIVVNNIIKSERFGTNSNNRGIADFNGLAGSKIDGRIVSNHLSRLGSGFHQTPLIFKHQRKHFW